ncbi:tyrosine-type recombinase/integrase [Enterococcus cecorum]|uniref:tyrosine-type recombinase/integrase n=1 Tax=Enterococcus cecorum TaxID=44008 RepID=UPI0032C41F5C
MASIKKYIKSDGTEAYEVSVYLGIDHKTGKEKRTKRRGLKSVKEANLVAAKLIAEAENKTMITKKRYTYKEIQDMFFEQYKNEVEESTWIRAQSTYNTINEKFGARPIEWYTPLYCQNAVESWKEDYASYKNLVSYCKRVFQYAYRMDLIKENPFDKVEIGKRPTQDIEEEKIKFFESDELKTFLNACEKDEFPITYPLFRVLAFCGLRKGEVLALSWDDINFKEKSIYVHKTLYKNSDGQCVVKNKTKNKKDRYVSFDEKTSIILKNWKMKQREYLLSFGYKVQPNNQLVFCSKTNHPIVLNRPNKLMTRICTENNLPDITVHGLRHTHCSLLFEAGFSIEEVKERLGHQDIRVTINIYTHFTKKKKDQIADKFAQYVMF